MSNYCDIYAQFVLKTHDKTALLLNLLSQQIITKRETLSQALHLIKNQIEYR